MCCSESALSWKSINRIHYSQFKSKQNLLQMIHRDWVKKRCVVHHLESVSILLSTSSVDGYKLNISTISYAENGIKETDGKVWWEVREKIFLWICQRFCGFVRGSDNSWRVLCLKMLKLQTLDESTQSELFQRRRINRQESLLRELAGRWIYFLLYWNMYYGYNSFISEFQDMFYKPEGEAM